MAGPVHKIFTHACIYVACDHMQVNGTNVLLIPSKNPYTFGLSLLDMFFSKEELSVSLLLYSSKSERAALDQAKFLKSLVRLNCFLKCIYYDFIPETMNKRYRPEDWDMKTFVTKAHQKCRDSKP